MSETDTSTVVSSVETFLQPPKVYIVITSQCMEMLEQPVQRELEMLRAWTRYREVRATTLEKKAGRCVHLSFPCIDSRFKHHQWRQIYRHRAIHWR